MSIKSRMIINHDIFIQWRQTLVINNNVDAFHKPNVEWKQLNSKEYTLYESIYKQTEKQKSLAKLNCCI